MNRWTSAVFEVTGKRMEDGDLLPVVISVFLGVFILSLLWTLATDRRSEPPF